MIGVGITQLMTAWIKSPNDLCYTIIFVTVLVISPQAWSEGLFTTSSDYSDTDHRKLLALLAFWKFEIETLSQTKVISSRRAVASFFGTPDMQ